MEYRRLGSTGLEISPICLGVMSFGDASRGGHPWVLAEEDARPLIKRAVDAGINFFDTANVYSKGSSEEILGRALRDFTDREATVVATKVHGEMRSGPNGRGLSRKAIFAEIDNSLKRLGMDYVDLLQIHRWDKNTPIEETMAALDDLVRAGKVRYLGVSDTPAWKIAEASLTARFRGWSSFIGLQIEYSLLQRTVEQELVPMAEEFGLGITPWSPLGGGALSGKYTRSNADQYKADRAALVEGFLNEKTYAVVDELEVIAKAHETTVASVALAWLHAQSAVTSIIIGARRLSQFEDNIRALDVNLTAEELARLNSITEPTLGFPQSMLTMAPGITNGGTTINGVSVPISDYVMPKGDQPY